MNSEPFFKNTILNKKSLAKEAQHTHQWVTVINPTNNRLLLQACDNCGVVKSENSVIRSCQQPQHQQLLSNLKNVNLLLTA